MLFYKVYTVTNNCPHFCHQEGVAVIWNLNMKPFRTIHVSIKSCVADAMLFAVILTLGYDSSWLI